MNLGCCRGGLEVSWWWLLCCCTVFTNLGVQNLTDFFKQNKQGSTFVLTVLIHRTGRSALQFMKTMKQHSKENHNLFPVQISRKLINVTCLCSRLEGGGSCRARIKGNRNPLPPHPSSAINIWLQVTSELGCSNCSYIYPILSPRSSGSRI